MEKTSSPVLNHICKYLTKCEINMLRCTNKRNYRIITKRIVKEKHICKKKSCQFAIVTDAPKSLDIGWLVEAEISGKELEPFESKYTFRNIETMGEVYQCLSDDFCYSFHISTILDMYKILKDTFGCGTIRRRYERRARKLKRFFNPFNDSRKTKIRKYIDEDSILDGNLQIYYNLLILNETDDKPLFRFIITNRINPNCNCEGCKSENVPCFVKIDNKGVIPPFLLRGFGDEEIMAIKQSHPECISNNYKKLIRYKK